MKNTMQPATLRKVVVTEVPIVRDGDLIYSLERQGPAKWRALRTAKYGKNLETEAPFQMQTMPQAVRLANYGIINKVEPVANAVNSYWLTGNSLMLWTPRGLYAIDAPDENVVAQLGIDEQAVLSTLEQGLVSKLGKREEASVTFSDDCRVRFTPLDKILFGEQTAQQLAVNPGNIVLSGSLQNAELNAETSRKYKLNPFFYGVQNPKALALRVPALYGSGFDDWLSVSADALGGRYWFGVQQTGEASAPKKE